MVTVALAALVSIVPAEPPRLHNGLDVAVTDVRVWGPHGSTRHIARLAGRGELVVPEAVGVESYSLPSCGAALRSVMAAEGDDADRIACLRAMAPRRDTLELAIAQGRGALIARAVFEHVDQSAAREILPELVSLETEGGELAEIVSRKLEELYLGTPVQALRAVDRRRRPELLTALGRHEDGRAFGLLVRAALESSIEAERTAAARALADYPDDAVTRLVEALGDQSSIVRARAEAALRQQDGRAREALRAQIAALGGRSWEDGTPIEYAQELIRVHSARRSELARSVAGRARRALADGSAREAEEALRDLKGLDRSVWMAERRLRAAVAVAAAREAIEERSVFGASGRGFTPRERAGGSGGAGGPPGTIERGDLATNGAVAVEQLFAADALDPGAPGLVDAALSVAEAFSKAGYPASASRVLAPFESRDGRAARERTRVLREEIGRLMDAGDRAGARMRLAQLVEEGHADLAGDLDDEFSVRGDVSWMALPGMSLLVCGCIGFAVRRERRRRRAEFHLIETEQDRGLYHEGVYR